jgi:hypothetical protein
VPFVRFSRDKRGYEHIYLLEPPKERGGHARILYWFRTPPDVKVGREVFDEDARRALESQYPEVHFDWNRIVNTPKPPPDAPNWRERRLAERARKKAQAAEEVEQAAGEESVVAPEEAGPGPAGGAEAPPPSAEAVAEEGRPGRAGRRRRRRGRRGRSRPGPHPGERSEAPELQKAAPPSQEAPLIVSDGKDL